MNADVFFDTNILLYTLSGDASKADRAESLLAQGGTVSVQVLNEFASVATRKLGFSWQEVDEVLGVVRKVCSVESLSEETYDRGRAVAERYRLSVYDSMIVAAALLAECKTLYSEDMHAGLRVEKQVTVRNPFTTTRLRAS